MKKEQQQDTFVELPYLEPAGVRDLFSHFVDEPWALLLDSGKTLHQASQFDIILARPRATFAFSHDKSTITGADIDTTNEPFEDLKRFYEFGLKDYQPLPSKMPTLPFNGGIAGFCSYDAGRYVENLPSIATNDIGLPELAFGLYEWAFISDHKNHQSYLVKFCRYCDSYWKDIVAEFDSLYSNSDNPTPASSKAELSLSTPWRSNMDKDAYIERFQKVHDYIHAGDCYQVNLAQRFSADFEGHPWNAYLKLTEHNQAPFSSYMNLESQQILSLSPERFIQVFPQGSSKKKKLRVVTQPIKGTRPRSQDEAEDKRLSDELQHSEKDRAENLMIVDLLRNDIGRNAEIGSVEVTKLFELQSFISVHHLVSTIEANLAESSDIFTLLKHCFPGGSITGAPKVRAMEIIEELEPHRRSIYCGSMLYLDFRGYLDSNIAIRTLVTDNGKIHAWAGGGLVADSEANNEYEETLHKLSKILPVLSVEELQ
ncbi:aminodeoxychorismate synthase component I [Kangiella spongicola]|uniref:aminodeoxychorismate synthase n=1 Tax=Kangiella spongicola TaxID=796379 RepID=A0A318CZW9_9GAMM|nr:aminodeoxychorismate synthase component I [Kangiella spongicola]PXF62520.1 aminodeoxychorismate synthase component I [Kangiella spongicola]